MTKKEVNSEQISAEVGVPAASIMLLQHLLSGKGTGEQPLSVSFDSPRHLLDGDALDGRDPVAGDGDILRLIFLVFYWTLREGESGHDM